MSFSDDPSYLTSLGRDLLGATAGVGPISLADMTSMTGDTISAFVGPALGIKNARSLDEVVARHPGIRFASPIAGPVTVSGTSQASALDVSASERQLDAVTRADSSAQTAVPPSAGLWEPKLSARASTRRRGRASRKRSCRLGPWTPCSHRRPKYATLRGMEGAHPDLEQETAPIRVVLADDSVLLREGIASLLEGKGFEIVGQSRHGRGSAAEGQLVQARHRDRGHQDAADADRRRSARREGDPREAPGDGGARPLPVRRGGLRARASAGERGRRRLPAEGPGLRPRRFRRRGQAGRRGRLRARPERRLATRRPATPRRPNRRPESPASERCSS